MRQIIRRSLHSRKKNKADLAVGLCSCSSVLGHRLEHNLARELDHARRRIEAQEVTVWTSRDSGHGRDLSEARVSEAVVRIAKVRVVKRVERLNSDGKVESLRELEVLEEVQVHVEEMRSVVLIAALRRPDVKARERRVRALHEYVAVQTGSWATWGPRVCRSVTTSAAAQSGRDTTDNGLGQNGRAAVKDSPVPVIVDHLKRKPERQNPLPENCHPLASHFMGHRRETPDSRQNRR